MEAQVLNLIFSKKFSILFPGGHASFFGLLNVFVHFFMYGYYMLAALGPKYQKYLWWKQHMTNLQMLQFVGIMVHGFQLVLYDDCDFPWQFAYYIAAHAVLFFILFSEFYVKNYLKKTQPKKVHHWVLRIELTSTFWCEHVVQLL